MVKADSGYGTTPGLNPGAGSETKLIESWSLLHDRRDFSYGLYQFDK